MPGERIDGLAAVLDAIRSGNGVTQPQLVEQVGLGRSVVAQRVAELEAAGLVVTAGLGRSTGGRAPRRLRLRGEAGLVAGLDIRAADIVVALTDLAGTVLAQVDEPIDVVEGPDVVLGRAEKLLEKLLEQPSNPPPLWGIGVGFPGPVEFDTGLPVAPPIGSGWDGYPIRDRLLRRFAAPVWVDNDVNLMTLAELRSIPVAETVRDMLYLWVDEGIGAGVVSGGRLHRGANGCAGDIGDVPVPEAGKRICRCGNVGCLVTVAGGRALTRQARELAESGASPVLAELLGSAGSLTVAHAIVAETRGDPAARTMFAEAGSVLGATLSTLVGFFNPGLVVLGGEVAASNEVLAAIRESVYRRSPALATRTLRIERSTLGAGAGLAGAIHLTLEALFSGDCAVRWLPYASPAGHPEIIGRRAA